MPHLVRFLIRHAAIGIAVAGLFVGALLAFDVAHLGTLVRESPSGLIAVSALTVALGITFGSVQMGFAVMLLGEEAGGTEGGTRARRGRTSRSGASRLPCPAER
ncbi:hypothetical protein [Ancylobacter pratisalsi]|uniref:hypothetical protein n=1 Tax=Ancylobacter pratisalsi TaxID=1745854 RepID=UPI001AED5BA6|nr:hypothetical protein [Ancylobacter pratisalsi]